ncbi:MAG: hypothetical protein H5U26_13480 [Immundisolibacter sp.]|jgi:hypothetical protein|uniref:hypothetical protein n=2 Tax=Immundisolibacter sp. TaxID=1934948 RepID=UPI0019986A5A|nr:hypothetical protein [Immundisolibacter sp.]MBC7163100.1 hypothetical protein [Immundisolibacter sp.]
METIGSISAVCGRVTCVDPNGNTRLLSRGEPVFADDTLVAALDAAAAVQLSSGACLHVAPGKLVVLDADVFETEESADDGSLRLADVNRVLGWLDSPARRSVA